MKAWQPARSTPLVRGGLAGLAGLAGLLSGCDFPTLIVEADGVPPNCRSLDVVVWQIDDPAAAKAAGKLAPIPYEDQGRYETHKGFTFGLSLPDPTHKFELGLAAFSHNAATNKLCLEATLSTEAGPYNSTTLHTRVAMLFSNPFLSSIGSTPCINDIQAETGPLIAGLRVIDNRIGQPPNQTQSLAELSILGWNFAPDLHVSLSPDIRPAADLAMGIDAGVSFATPDQINIRADAAKLLTPQVLSVTITSADPKQPLAIYSSQIP